MDQFIQHRHPFGGPDSDSDNSENELLRSMVSMGLATQDVDLDYEAENESDSSEGEIETSVKLPEWYKLRPFQYNGRVFLAFLPGFMLSLAIGGEFFLMVLTIGSFAVYITKHLEATKKVMTVFFVSFFCCHFTVLYSAFPLIWKSAFNLILLVALNMHMVLSGGWVALQLKEFRMEEPMLAKMIESFLFGLYPWSSIILITWLVAAASSSCTIAYTVIIFGFIVLQLFLTPTVSSFHRDSRAEDCFILSPQIVGLVTLSYCLIPPCLYLLTVMRNGIFQLIAIDTLVQWSFIVCVSVFLSTFFHIRQFLEVSGIAGEHLVKTRWSSGLFAVSLLGSVLQQYELTSSFLFWCPIIALVYTLFGYFISVKNKQIPALLCGLLVTTTYLFIFIQFPWQLKYTIGAIHSNSMYILLFINVLLSVGCAWSSSYASKEIFGFILLVQSVGFITGGKLLRANDLCSVLTLVCMGCCASYLILKLYHTGKLIKVYAWLSLSVHLTIVSDVTDQVSHHAVLLRSVSPPVAAAAIFVFSLAVTKILLFEEREEIGFTRALVYLCCLALSSIINTSVFISPIWWMFLHEVPCDTDAIGSVLLLIGVVFFKMATSHRVPHPGIRHLGPTLLGLGFTVILLKPGFSSTWECGLKWLLLLSIVTALCIIYSQTLAQSPLSISAAFSILAIPLGIQGALWAGVTYFVIQFIYASNLSVAMFLAVLSWQSTKKAVHNIDRIVTWIFSLSSLLTMLFMVQSWTHATPIFMLLSIVTVLEAGAYKYMANREKSAVIGEDTLRPDVIAYLGNLTTLLAYVLTCVACPIQVSEIWICGSSAIFLLLQKDPGFLSNLSIKNHTTPTIMAVTVTLIISTIIKCTVWSQPFGLQFLCGIGELIVLALTSPVYIVLYILLWTGDPGVSEKTIVFLTPPNVLLFLFASSYTSWCMSVYGIGVGTWIMTTKLQISR